MKTIDKYVKMENGKEVYTFVEFFDSPEEMIQVCQGRTAHDTYNDFFGNAHGDRRWNGFYDPKDMQTKLRFGVENQALINSVKKTCIQDIKCSNADKMVKTYLSREGYAPVVPLALMGVPQNMVNSKMARTKSRVVEVVWDVATSAGISKELIRETAMEVLKQVIGLELAGYRVRLTAIDTYASSDGRKVYTLGLKLKDESQPMNPKRILFPCTDVAFSRGASFGWYARMSERLPNYGCPLSAVMSKDNLNEYMSKVFGQNSVMIQTQTLAWSSNRAEVLKSMLSKKVEARE